MTDVLRRWRPVATVEAAGFGMIVVGVDRIAEAGGSSQPWGWPALSSLRYRQLGSVVRIQT